MKHKTLILSGVLVILVAVLAFPWSSLMPAFGSVSRSSEYHATSTTPYNTAPISQIVSGPGTLGSLIITFPTTTPGTVSTIYFYDATTTDVDARTGNKATSTITLFSIASNAATGTYTIDGSFINGLIMEVRGPVYVSGGQTLDMVAMPTSTLTWRE